MASAFMNLCPVCRPRFLILLSFFLFVFIEFVIKYVLLFLRVTTQDLYHLGGTGDMGVVVQKNDRSARNSQVLKEAFLARCGEAKRHCEWVNHPFVGGSNKIAQEILKVRHSSLIAAPRHLFSLYFMRSAQTVSFMISLSL